MLDPLTNFHQPPFINYANAHRRTSQQFIRCCSYRHALSNPVCKNSKCIPLLFMESSRINFPLNTKSSKFHINRKKFHICKTSKANKV